MKSLLHVILCAFICMTCSIEPNISVNPKALYSYDVEAKISELNISLPIPKAPKGANIVRAVKAGNLLFLSGRGPKKADGSNIAGKVGAELSVEEGYAAARLVAINQLAVLKAELGDLNRVVRIVKVFGMVNATSDFTQHSQVINGFSDLMVEVFGDRGGHALAAVGMVSLPGDISVEVDLVVEIME